MNWGKTGALACPPTTDTSEPSYQAVTEDSKSSETGKEKEPLSSLPPPLPPKPQAPPAK